MRISFLTIILIVAGLCFAAGYKLGQRSYTVTVSDERSTTSETSEQAIQPEPSPEIVTEIVAPIRTEPSSETVKSETATTENNFVERAQQRFITFTDTQDRSLVAEVVEVKDTALRIRRQADGRLLDLPIAMLSADDQAFAAYLQAQRAPVVEEQDLNKIFDELFK